MSENLYIIVKHRRALEQGSENEWGSQGRLLSIHASDQVLDAAEAAQKAGSKVFIYETSCPKPLKSHISQEVRVAEIRRGDATIVFDGHTLIYRKPPFRASQSIPLKWTSAEPLSAP